MPSPLQSQEAINNFMSQQPQVKAQPKVSAFTGPRVAAKPSVVAQKLQLLKQKAQA
ncbi:MAG: hypothetical protein WCJ81_09125 [bacterium]